MPDDAGQAGGAGGQNNGGAGSGADPKKTDNQNSQAIDVSKLGDEDFQKVFDDPRLWNHPRFKSLNEAAKKAKEFEAQEETRKAEELKKKGEFEELSKQNEAKAKQWQDKYTQSLTDNRIQAEAVKLGAVDLEDVLKLVDRANVKVSDDGSIIGAGEAVKALLDSKPYLKGDGKQVVVGGGTNPGGDTNAGVKRFKLSQIQNFQFYKDNEKDILASMKAGLIENDQQQ